MLDVGVSSGAGASGNTGREGPVTPPALQAQREFQRHALG